jgi:hypothetical protein
MLTVVLQWCYSVVVVTVVLQSCHGGVTVLRLSQWCCSIVTSVLQMCQRNIFRNFNNRGSKTTKYKLELIISPISENLYSYTAAYFACSIVQHVIPCYRFSRHGTAHKRLVHVDMLAGKLCYSSKRMAGGEGLLIARMQVCNTTVTPLIAYVNRSV